MEHLKRGQTWQITGSTRGEKPQQKTNKTLTQSKKSHNKIAKRHELD